MRIYLAGPMEYAPDQGIGWRKALKEHRAFEKHKVIWEDPTEFDNMVEVCKELRGRGEYSELKRIVKELIDKDLGILRRCDLVVGFIDPAIHSCGTYREIFRAVDIGIPVFLKGENVPSWLYGENVEIYRTWDMVVCKILNFEEF